MYALILLFPKNLTIARKDSTDPYPSTSEVEARAARDHGPPQSPSEFKAS